MKYFLLLFFLFPFSQQAFSQRENPAKKNENCRFVIKADEKFMGKEVVITKIGITGLSIKTTEKVKKKLTIFSEDKLVISEDELIKKVGNICVYKSYYLDQVELTFDENTSYKKTIPMIIRFHYKKD